MIEVNDYSLPGYKSPVTLFNKRAPWKECKSPDNPLQNRSPQFSEGFAATNAQINPAFRAMSLIFIEYDGIVSIPFYRIKAQGTTM